MFSVIARNKTTFSSTMGPQRRYIFYSDLFQLFVSPLAEEKFLLPNMHFSRCSISIRFQHIPADYKQTNQSAGTNLKKSRLDFRTAPLILAHCCTFLSYLQKTPSKSQYKITTRAGPPVLYRSCSANTTYPKLLCRYFGGSIYCT